MTDSPTPQLLAECLVAVTGIFPTSAPTAAQMHLAGKFVDKLAARVKAFLDSDKPEPFKPKKLPDQKELRAKLTTDLDPDQLGEWLAEVPPEVAAPYTLTIQAARAKVNAAWPTYPDTSLGLHDFDLAPDELMDVCLLLRTLDNIESVFDNMDARLLLPEQVQAIVEIYPDLAMAVQSAAYDALAPFMEIAGFVEKKKSLSPIKEEQIRILMQLPTDVPIEAPAKPAQGQQTQGKPGRRPSEPKENHGIGGNLETPTEHVAQRRIST